jgi:hypothetical protein
MTMSESVTKEFLVVLRNKAPLVAELERLAKRAAKIGAPAITWSFGEVVNRKVKIDGSGETRLVPFVPLTLTGSRPKVAGWEFAATVEHLDGVNILRSTPAWEEKELPEAYRKSGPVCDHCKLARRRHDTYLLVSEAGEWKSVGSTCLVDFLGHADPHKLAAYAELLAAAMALCGAGESDEEGGWGFGGSGPTVFALVEFLAHVAAEIRESGWTPKSAVLDRPGASTAEMAVDRIAPSRDSRRENPRDRSVTESDRAIAEAAAEWGLGLEASGEKLNDYLWNLYAVAKSAVVDHRSIGLAASMVAAYTKAEVRKREKAARKPSEHVGTVGEVRSFALLLDKHFSFESAWGWVDRFLFRDENDNVVTWKASGDSSVIGAAKGESDMVEGKRYILTGTIKAHDEYKGTKQTVLTRAAVRVFDEAVLGTLRDEENRKAFTKKVKAGTASPEEVAELAKLNAARKAVKKAAATKVAAFKTFESKVVETPAWNGDKLYAVETANGARVECVSTSRYVGYGSDRKVETEAYIDVRIDGYSSRYAGKDALEKARKLVSESLAKEDSEAA